MSTRSMSFTLSINAEPGSVQAAFLRRAIPALERISGRASTETLLEVLAKPTDAGSIADLLSRTDVIEPAAQLEPLMPAMARHIEHRRVLIAEAGGTLSAGEVGTVLGVTRQAVDKRRRSATLLAIRENSDWRYPSCQFHDGDVVAGLPEVVKGLHASGPWVILDFLLAPDAALAGQSPLEALCDGRRDAVLRLVETTRGDGFA